MVGFSEQNARRVVKATRASERDQFHPKQYQFNTAPQTVAQNFIPVKVMGVELGSSGSQNLHSWVRVELGSNGTWTEKPDYEKGGPDYDLPESSLLHPDNLAIEPGTVVLAHWSIDQGFLLAENDHIVSYKLSENMAGINAQANAKAVDGSGTEYGPEFKVVMSPFLYNQFGPALAGWYGYGYFSPKRNEDKDPPNQELNVIYQQRFAMGIEWEVSSGLEDCSQIASVLHFWNGEQPTAALVKMPSCLMCDCYKGHQCGTAIYCPDESTDTIQVYHIALINQLLNVEKLDDCATDACIPGYSTKNLRIGDGLDYEVIECEEYGCLGKLSNPGIGVSGTACGSSGSSGGTEVLELLFEEPLGVEVLSGDCPKRAKVKLGDFIEATGDDCITLTATSSGCKVYLNASFDPACSSGSTVVVAPGTCIGVDTAEADGTTTYTVNNTMTLTPGTCIGVDGTGCEKTINNTMTLTGGDCISVDGTGCEKTITNTMVVKGGDGITVSKSGCTYSVNLAGSQADPKTTLQLLCDIDIELSPIEISCVETSGGWGFSTTGGELTLVKKFTTLTLPSSLIESTSDCGGTTTNEGCEDCPDCEEGFYKIIENATGNCDCISHSQFISEGWSYCDEPTFSCDDCETCQEGYARIMETETGDCDCVAISVPLMSPPEGWIYCDMAQYSCDDCEITCPEGQDVILNLETGDCACHTFGDPAPEGWNGYTICPATPTPEGEGIQINGLDCDSYPPHVSYTFLGMPDGATSYTIDVIGDLGSFATIGPSFDHEEIPGQEYWGALTPGFGYPQPGECFVFNVSFAGSSATQTFSGCCP